MIDKNEIRQYIWNKMVEEKIASFPLPPHNRIPNFIGAEQTAVRIRSLAVYRDSDIIKVSPDSPQRAIREIILSDQKTLIMPTPRIRKGFLMINPRAIYGRYKAASTIKGAFRYGKLIDPEDLPNIDLIITGSVAVSKQGDRIGKGEGYSELEFAILRELNKVDEDIPIITNVHDVQVLDSLPRDKFDVSVDIIVTPTRIIEVMDRAPRPKGIYWEYINEDKMNEIPLLMKLYYIKRKK